MTRTASTTGNRNKLTESCNRIELPAGAVFAALTIEALAPSGRVITQAIPTRQWDSVPLAVTAGHLWAARNNFKTYTVTLEVFSERQIDQREAFDD